MVCLFAVRVSPGEEMDALDWGAREGGIRHPVVGQMLQRSNLLGRVLGESRGNPAFDNGHALCFELNEGVRRRRLTVRAELNIASSGGFDEYDGYLHSHRRREGNLSGG